MFIHALHFKCAPVLQHLNDAHQTSAATLHTVRFEHSRFRSEKSPSSHAYFLSQTAACLRIAPPSAMRAMNRCDGGEARGIRRFVYNTG